jgi:hypothetical protein
MNRTAPQNDGALAKHQGSDEARAWLTVCFWRTPVLRNDAETVMCDALDRRNEQEEALPLQ